jgi:hypothetical protein
MFFRKLSAIFNVHDPSSYEAQSSGSQEYRRNWKWRAELAVKSWGYPFHPSLKSVETGELALAD